MYIYSIITSTHDIYPSSKSRPG
ncbi:hypothetical protein RSAG8_01766, partial [Rhizoctonia solani AG-8 WAC10335]